MPRRVRVLMQYSPLQSGCRGGYILLLYKRAFWFDINEELLKRIFLLSIFGAFEALFG